jgi:adenine phosphoribosyltransferase
MAAFGTSYLLLFISFGAVSFCFFHSFGADVVPYPKRTVAIGEQVTLPCTNSSKDALVSPVVWWYKRSVTDDDTDVFANGQLINGYQARCTMQGYNLTFLSFTQADAGLYTCLENGGFGVRHHMWLAVSDVTTHSAVQEPNTGEEPVSSQTSPASTSDKDPPSLTVIVPSVVCPIVLVGLLLILVLHRLYKRRHSAARHVRRVELQLLRAEQAEQRNFWEHTLRMPHSNVGRLITKVSENVRDVFALTRQPTQYDRCISLLVEHIRGIESQIDAIVGLDTRGFTISIPVANLLRLPFIPIRKAGKLPGATACANYRNRHRKVVEIEVQISAFTEVHHVLVIDDELATGGGMITALKLMRQFEVNVVEFIVVLELLEYRGRQKLVESNITNLFSLARMGVS